MLTTVILVAATLASAIVGTLYKNPTKWVTALIIGFASVTAGATVVTSYHDDQQKHFAKAALGALIAMSSPTPAFNREFDKSIERAAGRHDLLSSGQVTTDSGVVYEFHKKSASLDDISAVLAMVTEDRAAVFLAYINGAKLDATVEAAMFTPPPGWGDASLSDEQAQALLDHEAFIGQVVLNDKLSWISADTPIVFDQSMHPLGVKVTASSQDHNAGIELKADFISSIRPLPPTERDGRAYREFASQLH